MKTLLLLLFAVAPVAADAPQRVHVYDLWGAQLDELDGKTVRIVGRLNDCRATACNFSEGRGKYRSTIALGDSESFDRAVKGLSGRQMLIEGVVNAKGFERIGSAPDGGVVMSWQTAKPGHRVGQLNQPRLISILSRR